MIIVQLLRTHCEITAKSISARRLELIASSCDRRIGAEAAWPTDTLSGSRLP
ncbi:hypothetical protein D805_1507 [Bifidobacterium thermophilum RBL67]|uniref:Uncharacterized protein n=1 Tax=Bifidobacterium thermophilum RBL67 TaxID=1254439 RepID=M4RHX0_9BIFI|nr:hypothetical protein D805_1507 [Bifidobacterium thermophilum RBL67]